jgi:probable phosphoglycerate mutase
VALTLSLVRHGQTTYNTESRLQGWCDSPLTPEGLAGVRTTAVHLSGRSFAAAYVSPSGRAQATALEILVHHPSAPPVTDPDLREFGFGDLEARPEAELFARHDPVTLFTAVLRGTFPGLPGGEHARDYLARVRAAFARIERSHADGEVLVVSHGLTLLAYLTMIDPRPRAPLPNASVTTVQVHPHGHRLIVDVAHDPARQSVAGTATVRLEGRQPMSPVR